MSQIYADNINEKTSSAGVTIELVKIEDGLISNVATPVANTDAVNKEYADAGAVGSHARTHYNGSGDEIDLARLVPSGDVVWAGHKITGLATCTASGDAANKKYVDDNIGGGAFLDLTDTPSDYTDDALKLVRVNAGENALEFTAASAGAAWRYLPLPAGAWTYPSTGGGAPLDNKAGNGDSKRHLFDDSVKEYLVSPLIEIPDDFNESGTVWLYPTGMAVTAATGKSIVLGIAHSARASGETWDVAYSSGDMGTQDTPNTQDQYHRFAFSSGAAALDWKQKDQLRLKLYRNPENAGDILSGDYGFNGLMIKIPRA